MSFKACLSSFFICNPDVSLITTTKNSIMYDSPLEFCYDSKVPFLWTETPIYVIPTLLHPIKCDPTLPYNENRDECDISAMLNPNTLCHGVNLLFGDQLLLICSPAIIAICFTVLVVKIHKSNEDSTIKKEKLLIAYLSITSAVLKSLSGICAMKWMTPKIAYYAIVGS